MTIGIMVHSTCQYLATSFEGADEVVPFSLRGRGTGWLSFTEGRNDEEVQRGS